MFVSITQLRFDNLRAVGLRYDMRCYFKVHSKAYVSLSQLNLPH